MSDQEDMYQKRQHILLTIKTSPNGPYQKQAELMMIKDDQIEIKHLIQDQVSDRKLTQKIELVKNVTLGQVIVHKQQNSDNLLTKCKVA